MPLLLLLTAAAVQFELLPEAQKFLHHLLHHHKDGLIFPAWYLGQEKAFQQAQLALRW